MNRIARILLDNPGPVFVRAGAVALLGAILAVTVAMPAAANRPSRLVGGGIPFPGKIKG